MSSKKGRAAPPGEDDHERILCPTLAEVTLVHGSSRVVGTLNISRVQLLFFGNGKELWVPYALVDSLIWRGASEHGHAIVLRCRDFNVYTLGVPRERDAFLVYQSIVNLLPLAHQDLDAIQAVNPEAELMDPGWTLYNPVNEYQRMGVGLSATQWRISTVNLDYSLCDTYPSVLAVPSACSDEKLLAAAKFRSRGRIPILSYLHPDNMGSITRCSQPLTGINQKRNADDEDLVDAIFKSTTAFLGAGSPPITPGSGSPDPNAVATAGTPMGGRMRGPVNLIVDARPRANAYANAAMGKGFESTDNYTNCRREFLGIENIHVMRDSLNAMIDATLNPQLTVGTWHAALDASGWLKHMHIILEATSRLVALVANDGANLLVHCSDGWDRTAQLTCMAMLCLDPYYRTVEGFLVLVDKEWLAVGHKFGHRLGHLIHPYSRVTPVAAAAGTSSSSSSSSSPSAAVTAAPPSVSQSSSTSSLSSTAAAAAAAAPPASSVSVAPPASDKHASEMSPVFLQFLDCVYQLLRQHPTQFEFTGRFLRQLYRLAHTSDTGTFLFNCERERRALVRQTRSAWTVLLDMTRSPADRPYLINPRYAPRAHARVLSIATSPAALRFWRAMYCPNEGPRLHEAQARALATTPSSPPPPSSSGPVPTAPLWELQGNPGPSALDEIDDPTLLPLGASLAALHAKVAWARTWLAEHGAADAATPPASSAIATMPPPAQPEQERDDEHEHTGGQKEPQQRLSPAPPSELVGSRSADMVLAADEVFATDDDDDANANVNDQGVEKRDEEAAQLMALDPEEAAALARKDGDAVEDDADEAAEWLGAAPEADNAAARLEHALALSDDDDA